MKKNNFDPFMINNFSNVIKQGKNAILPTSDAKNNELIGITFMEKSTNMSIPKVRTGLVLLITSDSLGENNELGIALMKGFCESIASGFNLPEYVFFINTGVKLIFDESMLEIFKKVRKYGTNIVISLESLEYFNQKDIKLFNKWSLGDITTILVNANQVIKI